MEFQPWPSISRLNKEAIYTEKIDGTNAAVVIERIAPYGGPLADWELELLGWSGKEDVVYTETGVYLVAAQSRKRFITPGDDNFAFAKWVFDNSRNLIEVLGEGRHFGEWWGSGIQGGYGLSNGERRFSLFNVKRWEDTLTAYKGHDLIPQLYLVPVLERTVFSTEIAKSWVEHLREYGSVASPDFMKPEGVVVFHTASGTPYKTFLENDLIHKSLQEGNK
ncbi:RNA ligase [Streptomyces phage BRock]|uniref:RNA ligase n=1 Tax=Streptomyces phage BRock TaxID=1913591 RepID=A0A1J0GVY8_9CAUD|nr:RNA ligase [Streptomyces phage BRock]APC46339.1 RNA ligase [Streptomyces phage BRock]